MTDGGIADRLGAVRARIAAAAATAGRAPEDVELLAVSKTHPSAAVAAAFAAGQRRFGENRVQELQQKARELTGVDGLRWHLIGSLQTNKIRDLLSVPGLELVHSVDRPKLALALQAELARQGRRLAVLLQVHATGEATKHGCPPEELGALLATVQRDCPALEVQGLMAMGPQDGDPAPVFRRVAAQGRELRAASGLPLATLSFGMSGDLEAAVACGSTLVRVGTDVFGARA